ncbi:MAG TPA: hypothetical protein VFT91_07185 [Dehalococcoidia bacterium]|nr:hypothetical protein [Dehalococcoidia bacterium]
MTSEARLGFVLLFFALWCLIGLLPWTVAAVLARGRGALLALPLALAGAAAGGVLVPALGLRDTLGFILSLPAALAGGLLASAAGLALARRLSPQPVPHLGDQSNHEPPPKA